MNAEPARVRTELGERNDKHELLRSKIGGRTTVVTRYTSDEVDTNDELAIEIQEVSAWRVYVFEVVMTAPTDDAIRTVRPDTLSIRQQSSPSMRGPIRSIPADVLTILGDLGVTIEVSER